MSQLPPQVTINSLIETPQPYVGITDRGQAQVPVQLYPTQIVWGVTSEPDGGVHFTIDNFQYTGADGQGNVFVSDDPSQDLQWYVNKRSECGDNAYDIELYDSRPALGWTVSDPSNNASPIVIGQIDTSACQASQLFQITAD